jgi:hypothetical protein
MTRLSANLSESNKEIRSEIERLVGISDLNSRSFAAFAGGRDDAEGTLMGFING